MPTRMRSPINLRLVRFMPPAIPCYGLLWADLCLARPRMSRARDLPCRDLRHFPEQLAKPGAACPILPRPPGFGRLWSEGTARLDLARRQRLEFAELHRDGQDPRIDRQVNRKPN